MYHGRHSPYLSTSTIRASAVDGQLIYKGLQLFVVLNVFVATIVPKEENTRSLKFPKFWNGTIFKKEHLLYRIIVRDTSQNYRGYRGGLKIRRICSRTSQ